MRECLKCGEYIPYQVTIDGKARNLKSRKYCLKCSPFGQHNTTNLEKRDRHSKLCGKCGETDHNKFSKTKNNLCKKCHNAYTITLSKDKRAYALDKLGGKCNCCGFDKFPCSLDIHHTDPSIKDKHFKTMKGWSVERIGKEIESCILLCRNCHSAYHNGYLTDEDIFH